MIRDTYFEEGKGFAFPLPGMKNDNGLRSVAEKN